MKSFECPTKGYKESDVVTMAHGSGGGAMQRLIHEVFARHFPYLQKDTDAAVLSCEGGDIAFTTDSFVVDPLFFPGGNIGSLAVHGTINDLAMVSARAEVMSVAFIIEEGFPLSDLEKIVQTMANEAEKQKVRIITGDTKVVEKGHGHGIYINTTGIGVRFGVRLRGGAWPSPKKVSVGDRILVSGDIGRHGMAIMSVRENLPIETEITSDSAPLKELVIALFEEGIHVSCMRDATRGGVASALNEIARARGVYLRINEEKIPVSEEVWGLSLILGIDPLHIANEGRFVLFVPKEEAEHALFVLRDYEEGKNAEIIGEVMREYEGGLVTAITLLGSEKIIQMPEGEILPRIC